MGINSIRRLAIGGCFPKRMGSTYPAEVLTQGGAPDIETFAQMYYEEATAEGVRPEVAFAQAMKETGWLQYGGDMQITQYNFAGIGTTGGGVPRNSYPDVRTGIRAQIQHLKAYATDEALVKECVDDRYSYVTKGSAPYVEWLGQKENPEGYGWATGERYGYDIVEMIHAMRK
ncbi:MAG: glucosaminidase domain-containing protein [Coprococcus sp.]